MGLGNMVIRSQFRAFSNAQNISRMGSAPWEKITIIKLEEKKNKKNTYNINS